LDPGNLWTKTRHPRDGERGGMAHNQRDECRHRRFTYLSHRRSAPWSRLRPIATGHPRAAPGSRASGGCARPGALPWARTVTRWLTINETSAAGTSHTTRATAAHGSGQDPDRL